MVGATHVGARWALHDLAPLARWHTDRVVLMGDAAHAMVPHQGQGANQTIEDAIVLADCLADVHAADDLAAALQRYTDRRRRRTVAVQWLSRRTADLMHLRDGPEVAQRMPCSRICLRAGLDPRSRRARRPRPARSGGRLAQGLA